MGGSFGVGKVAETILFLTGKSSSATKATDIRAAFAADSQRFSRFSVSLDELLMDFSKTAVNDDILKLLLKLAEEGGVENKREEM
ncbi:hypothetical protein ACC758_38165, partial [Rhizobium ruizarguesonis]